MFYIRKILKYIQFKLTNFSNIHFKTRMYNKMYNFLNLKHLLENKFNLEHFKYFIRNLFKNNIENFNEYIPLEAGFSNYVNQIHTIYTYIDSNNKKLDVVIAYLNPLFDFSVGYNAINFAYNYFTSRSIDSALIAFVNNTYDYWVLSFAKLIANDIASTPNILRQYYIVGKNQKIFSAFIYLKNLLNLESTPTIEQIQEAFSQEKLIQDFIKDYKKLHSKLVQEVQKIYQSDNLIQKEFEINNITIKDFADKILYQLSVLQYLQDRGRLAVYTDQTFGEGKKNFLKQLFQENSSLNFYNDILEPFIHEGLGKSRDYDYYSHFDLRVPFLNTILFNSKFSYNWVSTNINIPNEIFSNNNPTEYEDILGDGILDIFERYNFTITKSRKLDNVDKEIAVNLEIFQNNLFNDDNLKIFPQNEDKETQYAYNELEELNNYYDYETFIIQIKQKIQDITIPLKDLELNVKLGLGINKKLIFSNETVNEILSNCKTLNEEDRTRHIIQPLFKADDIQKYYSQWSGYFTINKPEDISNINIHAYPSIKKFLENLIKQESKNKDNIINNLLQDINNINPNYKKEKIILKIDQIPYAYYDTTSYLIDNQLLIIYGDIETLEFIYPILNSKLFLFLTKLYLKENNDKLTLIKEFPILNPNYLDSKIIKKLSHLAINITQLKSKNPIADITAYEEEINEIIYELYGLNSYEIELIPKF